MSVPKRPPTTPDCSPPPPPGGRETTCSRVSEVQDPDSAGDEAGGGYSNSNEPTPARSGAVNPHRQAPDLLH